MKKLYIEKSIEINAPISKVWDALINPAIIKQYLFGTEAVSDWKEGSSLEFKGVWEGKEYLDKGIILKLEPNKNFRYSYLSSFSGLEDIDENYAVVDFQLSPVDGKTRLTLTQDNIETEEARKHSDENWGYVLNTMKNILE